MLGGGFKSGLMFEVQIGWSFLLQFCDSKQIQISFIFFRGRILDYCNKIWFYSGIGGVGGGNCSIF